MLEQFDEIFAVLKDDDAAKVRATVEWAKAEGLADKISAAAAELAKAASLSDADVEKLVAEHSQARKARTSRAPTPFAISWRRTASFWRTPKTACGGRGSRLAARQTSDSSSGKPSARLLSFARRV